jgi:hypothetical protein
MIPAISGRRRLIVATFLHAGPNVVDRDPPADSPEQTVPEMAERPALTRRAMWR